MTLLRPASNAAVAFQLQGDIRCIEQHGDGLINDTFAVTACGPNGNERFILQRINQDVFVDPTILMGNMEHVIKHVQLKAAQAGRDPERAIPSLISTIEGGFLHQADGESWRMLTYIEGTTTIDHASNAKQAYEIAFTFGRFLDDLSDFPVSQLNIALPGYRNTERYLAALWQAVADDRLNRAKSVLAEIAFVERRVERTMCLQRLQRSGLLPQRVIHGDTKMNNVLLDEVSGNGICAIDLDTVMPGLRLHDVGDCIREALVVRQSDTLGSLSQQDLQLIEALVSGFMSWQSGPKNAFEVTNIGAAISSITLELGVRFLCDYLLGDIYFRTDIPTGNLVRAQRHFRLQERIEASQSSLQESILRYVGGS